MRTEFLALLLAALVAADPAAAWDDPNKDDPWRGLLVAANDPRHGSYLAELQVEDIKKGVAAFKEKMLGYCGFEETARTVTSKSWSRLALTVEFSCATDIRKVEPARPLLADLGTLRSFGLRPDKSGELLRAGEEKLALLEAEYNNNRAAFEKLPIGASLMEARLERMRLAREKYKAALKKTLTRFDVSISQAIPDGLPQEELIKFHRKILHKPGTPYKDPLTEP